MLASRRLVAIIGVPFLVALIQACGSGSSTATITRTAIPAATTAATATTEEPAQSDGLGLSSHYWDANHIRGEYDGGVYQYDQKYLVRFWENNRISQLDQSFRNGVPLSEAQIQAEALIPRDRAPVSQTATQAGSRVEVYTSAWLARQFPAPANAATPNPWGNGNGSPPGTFIVVYDMSADGKVTALTARLGNNP